jgi:site-specific recombinase XerD
LAARTRDAYGQHVRAYAAWLAGRSEPGLAISDPRGRDHAARDFKRHLKTDRGWRPASVNLALAAVDGAGGGRALFVGPRGRRLTPRSVDRALRGVAARAGLALSAHVLRHTCVTNLVRGGNDLVLVAELAGHRRLETTRR